MGRNKIQQKSTLKAQNSTIKYKRGKFEIEGPGNFVKQIITWDFVMYKILQIISIAIGFVILTSLDSITTGVEVIRTAVLYLSKKTGL